jgi:hypothetical protein
MKINHLLYVGKSDVSMGNVIEAAFYDFHNTNTDGKIQRLLLTPF